MCALCAKNHVGMPEMLVRALPNGPVSLAYFPPMVHHRTHFFPTAVCLGIMVLFSQVSAARLTGTVRSAQTARPLQGVAVSVGNTDIHATTDSLGDFRIDSIAVGSWNIDFVLAGYDPLRRNDFHVGGSGTYRVDCELMPALQKLDDMVVRGSSYYRAPDMTSSTKIMNRDELMRAPGALMDVQRAVQNLPSVSSGADNVNEVIVRGGMPGENLFVMDNIIIPNPNHFADQSSGGGVISLINPLLVNKITFNAGPPPAQYGGKASSVIDVKLREGTKEMVLGGVDIGVAGAGLHLEGPLWPRATFMASGTKSYLGFVSHFAKETAIPKYWGAQGKLTQHAGNATFTLNGVLGDNNIHIRNADETANLDYEQIRAGGFVYATGGTWEQFLGDILSTSITVSATGNTFDRLTWTPATEDTGFVNNSNEQHQRVDGRITADFDNGYRIQAGAYGQRADFDLSIREKQQVLVDHQSGDTLFDTTGQAVASGLPPLLHDFSWMYGGYVSTIVPLFDRARLIPGIRVDGFEYTGSKTVSPRLAAVVSLVPGTDITAAFGVQYQEPSYAELAVSKANRRLKPRRVLTGTMGLERTWDEPGVKVVAETFVKHYDHVTIDRARLGPYGQYAFLTSYELVDTGESISYGLELFAQKKLIENLFCTAAYSWSKAQTRFPGYARGDWFPSDYDFGHVVTLSGGGKFELLGRKRYERLRSKLLFRLASPIMPLADRTELSVRFRCMGGRPYTPASYDENYKRWVLDTQHPNSRRRPPYHRLDLRWERRYGFGLLHMIYYIELQNLYGRHNIWAQFYNDTNGRAGTISQLPFFPAGGVIIGF